jgi:predicted CopG family antitoxin
MKRIEISDKVYRRLKCEKGDRSFSEVVADALEEDGGLIDVTGQQALDPESAVPFEADTERPSDGILDSEDT